MPKLPLNFTKTYNFPENNHIKSIIRGRQPNVQWMATPHTPLNPMRCCNNCGEPCFSQSPFAPFNFDWAYIKHFTTKTIQEWLETKQKRGYPDQSDAIARKNLSIDKFFELNKKTPEKLAFIEKFIKEKGGL